MTHKIYRTSTLGYTLQKSLERLVEAGQIPPSLARKVLYQFDKSIDMEFNKNASVRMSFRAERITNYRFCDKVWSVILHNVDFRDGDKNIDVNTLRLVACDIKNND